jgi:hypothetical protein
MYLFTASNGSYWLAQIGATQLPGSPFANVLLVCVGEVSGVFLAGALNARKWPDNLTNQIFALVVIITSFSQYFISISADVSI